MINHYRPDDWHKSWSDSGWRRLALFLTLAAWIHLLAFLGWERSGLGRFNSMVDLTETPRMVELTLELNPAAQELQAPKEPEPASAFTPAPEPAVKPEIPPSPPETSEPQVAPAPTDPAATPDLTLTEPNNAFESRASLWPEETAGQTPKTGFPARDEPISLEETAPRFKSYNTTVRGAVARHWLLPPEAKSNFQPGRFTAIMTLDREGRVVVIAVEESSGSPSLDYAAMEALRGAAPYEPFPEELAHNDQLSFRLHFDYRAVYRQAAPLK
jgi:protein TonB